MGDPTTIKARSGFEPADNPATIAHLSMLQAITTRLAGRPDRPAGIREEDHLDPPGLG